MTSLTYADRIILNARLKALECEQRDLESQLGVQRFSTCPHCGERFRQQVSPVPSSSPHSQNGAETVARYCRISVMAAKALIRWGYVDPEDPESVERVKVFIEKALPTRGSMADSGAVLRAVGAILEAGVEK